MTDIDEVFSNLEPSQPHKYTPVFGPSTKLRRKGTHAIPVLYPNQKDMLNFSAYIEKIERDGRHLESGIAKIVPPASWLSSAKEHFKYEDLADMEINQCMSVKIQRVDEKLEGVYWQKNIRKDINGTTVASFMQRALDANTLPKKCKKLDDALDYSWNSFKGSSHGCSALYGADIQGSLFGDEIEHFNPNKLNTLIDLAKESGMEIPGITSPYLYFGSIKTAFSWHVEDMDLYSLNYQHFGEPKIWYAIPSAASGRFERLCAQLYKKFGVACHSFLRHKICLTHPDILEQFDIPYGVIAQYPGEFIVTFPRGYHMGINIGFNCNEAINFAINRWFGYGLQASICDCNPEMSVRMNLRTILKKYAEDDHQKEFFIRESVKSNERIRPGLAISGAIQEAKPILSQLLLFNSSFEEERTYNTEQAEIAPFCSVCQYFTPPTNCNLKGSINSTSKSPCYVSSLMLSKTQSASINPYRLDKSKGKYLPPTEVPLRQCVNCKVAVHATCYSFIEGLPSEKTKSKEMPPEIRRVSKPTLSKITPNGLQIPKTIRITAPKNKIKDIDVDNEESRVATKTSPTPIRRLIIVKSEDAQASNNIYKKIMDKVKLETGASEPSLIKKIYIKKEMHIPANSSSVDVIKPILPKDNEIENHSQVKDENSSATNITQADEWLCDPCRILKDRAERRKYVCCEFCNVRGGALIQRKLHSISENGYVHVICAIISRLTSIERNKKNELIAHSFPHPREGSVIRKCQKNLLSTTEKSVRLCATYSNHDKALFTGNFEDNFCGLCKEALYDVLVKCEKCHLEGRRMDVYHPTCAHLLGFQFCARVYPEVVVAICPGHFDMSNNPKTNVQVGDNIVHKINDELFFAEVVFIGSIKSEIVMSFQGGFSEVDKNQILTCECKAMGCNGNHFPGYLAAIKNRGALGVTLGVFRGKHIERSYRVKHEDGLAITCKRSDIYTLKDGNCPPEAKKILTKKRREREILDQMNVPIKRERISLTYPDSVISISPVVIKQEITEDEAT